MDDSVLRKQLVDLVRGGHAHVPVKEALSGIAPEIRAAHFKDGVHSIWEELEHMRIAQEDILRYTLDRSWQSPPWPAGYWPAPVEQVSDAMWEGSVASFLNDIEAVVKMVEDQSRDLTAEIPHGEGRTYLRQVLLVADHNAYHLGQIVQARKLLNNWG
jgi:hypothetical protein